MAMLHLFHQAGVSVGVAHCNFQLRGAESDGDEKFVLEVCKKNNIPFYTHRFETKSFAEANGVSIQIAARELRYAWFYEVVEREKFDGLATAHHFNDSIETVLLNWINGQSIEGFTGIPVKNGKIIRPLLFASRDEIELYAKENRLAWREDSSNLTLDYQRNFLRHKVVPLLKEISPSLESTLQRGISKITGDVELLESALEDWKKKFVLELPEKITIQKDGLTDPSTGSVLLWRFIRHFGFNYDTCVSVMEAINGQPGKKFIGPAHVLSVDRENLILSPKVDYWNAVQIEQAIGKAFLGSWSLEIKESSVKRSENISEAILDVDKIKFPMCWRQWRVGDVFFPLGMEHRKKVSDLLIDQKVSIADKALVTVLESNGQIIWVVGHRIDNRYKITEHTKKAISIRVAPYFV